MKVLALDLESSGEVPDALCGDCQDTGLAGKSNALFGFGNLAPGTQNQPCQGAHTKGTALPGRDRAAGPAREQSNSLCYLRPTIKALPGMYVAWV